MNSLRLHPPIALGALGTLLVLGSCAAAPESYSDRLSAWERMHAERTDLVASLPEQLGPETDLAGLLEYARANNPGLEAAFLRWKEALERIPQANSLANPRLSFSGYLSEVETRVGPMEARVGLSQPLPWFGERRLKGEVAFAGSEEHRELLESARLKLEHSVVVAWCEYAWVERAVQITEGNRELLSHWESVARVRMETGLGSHADVIRAQVELGKLEDRVQSLADMRRPLAARLNASLGRPTGSVLPTPTFPLQSPPTIDERRLSEELVLSSPVLRALEHRIEGAEHGVDLADKAFYPDFFVGADYTFIGSADAPGVSGSGDDAIALTIGFDLPIWRRSYQAGARAADARMRAARKEHEDARHRLSSDLELALYQFRDAHRRVGLFRDSLIPKGEESVSALDTAYQSGDEGFLDVIDAERVLLEFQLQAARAEVDRAKALAEIERITGTSLQTRA